MPKLKKKYQYLNVHYMYTFFIVPNIYIRDSTESILFVAGNVRGLLKVCWFVGSEFLGILTVLFITLLNIRGDMNSWVRVSDKIHER